MTRRLLIVLMNTDPRNAEELGAPFYYAAVANALSVVRDKLGWASDSEARSETLTHFASVARAAFLSLAPPEAEADRVDVAEALAAFESWYAATHPQPFWVLFETYMPETPRVDF